MGALKFLHTNLAQSTNHQLPTAYSILLGVCSSFCLSHSSIAGAGFRLSASFARSFNCECSPLQWF